MRHDKPSLTHQLFGSAYLAWPSCPSTPLIPFMVGLLSIAAHSQGCYAAECQRSAILLEFCGNTYVMQCALSAPVVARAAPLGE